MWHTISVHSININFPWIYCGGQVALIPIELDFDDIPDSCMYTNMLLLSVPTSLSIIIIYLIPWYILEIQTHTTPLECEMLRIISFVISTIPRPIHVNISSTSLPMHWPQFWFLFLICNPTQPHPIPQWTPPFLNIDRNVKEILMFLTASKYFCKYLYLYMHDEFGTKLLPIHHQLFAKWGLRGALKCENKVRFEPRLRGTFTPLLRSSHIHLWARGRAKTREKNYYMPQLCALSVTFLVDTVQGTNGR